MTYMLRTYIFMPACLPACVTDQARAALSACGGDPFLARTSACSCTPDFCQRNLHLARISRFNLLHSAAGRKQSENSVALPIVRLVLCALPPGLIAALHLRCTLSADGIFCKLYVFLIAPHPEYIQNQLFTVPNRHQPILKRKNQSPRQGTSTYFRRKHAGSRHLLPHSFGRLQRAGGGENLQDRSAHGIGSDSRIPLPYISPLRRNL
jgi:hypothetical protein